MSFADGLKDMLFKLGDSAEFKGFTGYLLQHSPKARRVLLNVLSGLIDAPHSSLTEEQVGELETALLSGYEAAEEAA